MVTKQTLTELDRKRYILKLKYHVVSVVSSLVTKQTLPKQIQKHKMFVVGKRKCGVGRYHSKEHVYVCLERASRKIRRIVVRDKSSDVLSVFAKHPKPNTEMCVDPGTENTYFDQKSAIQSNEK